MLSKDAINIMGLPHARHPALAGAIRKLAGMPTMTLEKALYAIERTMEHFGLHELDIEMAQPDASVKVPFAPARTEPGNEFGDCVNHHVHVLINGEQRWVK